MLSDPEYIEGGRFVTFTDGEAVPHALKQGDAILFRSEKHHHVTTGTGPFLSLAKCKRISQFASFSQLVLYPKILFAKTFSGVCKRTP